MARGFKLPKGNRALTLGHNRQIKPMTTRYAGDGLDSTPFKQGNRLDTDKIASGEHKVDFTKTPTGYSGNTHIEQVDAKYSGNEPGDFTAGGGKSFSECCPERTDTPYDSTVCPGVECAWAEDEPGTPGVDNTEDWSNTKTPGKEEYNTLTPHQIRRNNRGYGQVAGRSTQRNIDGANRRIRRAIRRGVEPSAADMRIVSTGNNLVDPNMNPYQYTPNTSGFGVEHDAYGGVATPPTEEDVMEKAKGMTQGVPGSAEYNADLIENMRIIKSSVPAGPQPPDGAHLDDKTIKLMKRKGQLKDNKFYDYSIKPSAQELNNPNKKAFLSKNKKKSHGGQGTKVGNWLRKTF